MNVRYTKRALGDLNSIADYIAEHNRKAVSDIEQAISRTADNLADFPMLGIELKELKVRKILVPKSEYAIYYRVEFDEVWIVHIRHGRRKPLERGDV